MSRNALVVYGLIMLLVLCSCNGGFGKKETGAAAGAAGGAILGQALGSSTEATLLGGAIGGVLGYVVGDRMEKSDRQNLGNALETTPSYETTRWENEQTGNEYAVTPKPTSERDGRICREVEIQAEVDGEEQTTQALACRENGNWVLQ